MKKETQNTDLVSEATPASWKPSKWRAERPIFHSIECDDIYVPSDLFEPYKRPGDELRECLLRNTTSGTPAAVTVADDDGSFEVSPLSDIRLDKVEIMEAIGDKKIASVAAQSGINYEESASSGLDPLSPDEDDRPDTIATVAKTASEVKEN